MYCLVPGFASAKEHTSRLVDNQTTTGRDSQLWIMISDIGLVGGWATPLKNMKVNGKDDIPYIILYYIILYMYIPILIMEHKKYMWNHQPVKGSFKYPRTHHQPTGPPQGLAKRWANCRILFAEIHIRPWRSLTLVPQLAPTPSRQSRQVFPQKKNQAWDKEQNQRLQDGRLC